MSKLINILCEEFGVPDVGAPTGMNSVEDVNTKIERAEKIEEVDTVTFGLETDDARIIKVYVKAEQADDFEEALSKELGVEDVIEDVLNKLSKDFDIIDVEWPDEQRDSEESEEDDELSVDDVDMEDEEETDGSESMNKKAWKGGKSGREKVKHLVKKESDMSYGQLFTKKLLGEMGLEEGKRFVTMINGKEKVFMAFDEKTANNMAKKWGGEPVKPFKGHNTGGAKKKVTEGYSGIDAIVDKFGKAKILAWLDGKDDDKLQQALYDYYCDSGEMPYGTMKARDGDPDNWIADRFPDDLASEGYIDKKTYKWIAQEGLVNEFKYGGPAKDDADEEEVVKQPGGKKYKVGLLDSRFSTVYQFMIYQALLDLGIPDEALNRAPQKNALVVSIRNMAKELQKDPVRRQALRFLINRLKETSDVNEAKKTDDADLDKDGHVSEKERKEAEAMKVGQLDDRFVTVIQKMLYQTILMLGLPDSFLVKSSYKNTIVNSIKNKAKEFQKDSVKRSALRIFTNRFETKTNESLSEQRIDENVGSDTVDFIANLLNKLVPEDKTELVSKLEDTSAWQQVKRAITSNTKVNQVISPIRQNLISISKKLSGTGSTFQEQLQMVNEVMVASQNLQPGQVLNIFNAHWRILEISKADKKVSLKVKALTGERKGKDADFEFPTWVGIYISTAKKFKDVNEAKWGDEPMLDDPEDKEKDPDAKVKLPRRKKDKRAGEEAEWEIKKVKKTGELKISTEGLEITLDDESTEKLIKAIANKSIAVLPDADISGTKWVFSPRARTYMVKKAGTPTTEKPLILSWADTNSIEDIYLGK